MSRNSVLHASVALMGLALACSSSSDDSGGGTSKALGDQMSELSDLGDRFVGENQATYDTLDEASQLFGAALAGGAAAASTAPKQGGCLPPGVASTTVLVDVQSNTFTPTNPQGPPDAVQFRLLSDPQTEVGYVNVSCTGVLPNPTSINISVNTTNQVEVLSLVATNLFAFPPASFAATLTGTLRSADGQDEVPFGQLGFGGNGSFVSLDEFSRTSATSFLVGQTVNASVIQNAFSDPSFPSEDISLVVEDTVDFDFDFNCPSLFSYRAMMSGAPGNVNGGGIFCARPPLGDDFNYFVNCDSGSIDNLVVSEADASCQDLIFEGDPTPVPGSVLQDIQDGTNALLGMHTTVISVAEAGAQVAIQLIAESQQQPF